MIRTLLSVLFDAAASKLAANLGVSVELPRAEIIEPRDPSHGDFACNFAMVASKSFGKPPRDIAQGLIDNLPAHELVQSVEIAGPGFLNIRLNAAAVGLFVGDVLELGEARLASAADQASANRGAGQAPALHADAPNKPNINIEFVSVNPNGPITVGSGRGAAFGSTLANVLEAAGHGVHCEYYINDGVNSEQMRQFADSVRSFVEGLPFPEKGYKGDYVQEVADEVKATHGATGNGVDWYQTVSQELMLARQRTDLVAFGVEFSTWFSEQSLHDRGMVEQDIADLEAKGAADTKPFRTKLKLGKGGVVEDVEIEDQATAAVEEDDDLATTETEPTPTNPNQPEQTLWLRSTKFADDMDRVLRRKDGRLTYISSDVAYHKDKFNRGSKPKSDGSVEKADKLITVLGPDHHGYIGRLHAVLAALLEAPVSGSHPATSTKAESGTELSELEAKIYVSPEERDACQRALNEAREKLEVVIFQIVRFVKDGQPAPMRKRDGNIYSLRDLMSEIGKTAAPSADEEEQMRIGKDVARFFYLMRSHDTHMDFDIDLATKQSDENPVFYCQYAHARICSVIKKAEESGFPPPLPTLQNASQFGRGDFDLAMLTHERETALIKKILDLPYEVQRCAEDYGVHRLTTYAQELAKTYHHFYDQCRVIQPEQPELTKARLALCQATAIGLRAVFQLLGISAPVRMEREAAVNA